MESEKAQILNDFKNDRYLSTNCAKLLQDKTACLGVN